MCGSTYYVISRILLISLVFQLCHLAFQETTVTIIERVLNLKPRGEMELRSNIHSQTQSYIVSVAAQCGVTMLSEGKKKGRLVQALPYTRGAKFLIH